MAILLAAFFANAFGILRADSRLYQGLNAAGAAIACAASALIGFIRSSYWKPFGAPSP